MEYAFEFKTEADAKSSTDPNVHWFKVPDVLDLPEGPGIFQYVQRVGLGDHPRAFLVLDALWRAVHQHQVVSFYEEEGESLSKVLDIFVRVNSGGTVLAKSDLLLSIATAQWKERDAREAVHGLVDDLNATHFDFAFPCLSG